MAQEPFHREQRRTRKARRSRPNLQQSDSRAIRQANLAIVGNHALDAEAVADEVAPGLSHLSAQVRFRRQLDEGGGQGSHSRVHTRANCSRNSPNSTR